MAQLIQLKQRIQAVETIRKITNAMRITAMSTHSKMSHQLIFLKNYELALKNTFNIVQAACSTQELSTEQSTKKKLIIIIGSDKGLCGNFNSALIHFFKHEAIIDADTTLFVIGKKIAESLRESAYTIDIVIDHFSFNKLQEVARTIFDKINNHYTHVEFFFTQSKSFFLQKPIRHILFPTISTKQDANDKNSPDTDLYVWQQDPCSLIEQLNEEFLLFSIKHILFDSMYAEQSARFKSMDSATRNAESILEEMKIQYSKLRQAKITKELTELSGHF